jgi:hypothetical protein
MAFSLVWIGRMTRRGYKVREIRNPLSLGRFHGQSFHLDWLWVGLLPWLCHMVFIASRYRFFR